MSIIQIKSLDQGSRRFDIQGSRQDAFGSTKDLTGTVYQNSSLRQAPSRDAVSSQRNRSTSNNNRSKSYKREPENAFSQIASGTTDTSNNQGIPLTSSTEKKIFNQVYKLKTIKFRPYVNETEKKSRKTIDETRSSNKAIHEKELKRLEDSRNISHILSQISQRDMSNSSMTKIVFENNHNSYKVEKITLDYENKGNRKSVNSHQRNAVSSSKDGENSRNSQRSHYKSNEMNVSNQFPSYKREMKPNTSQIRRVGDLDLFNLNPRPPSAMKQEHSTPVKQKREPSHIHRRGLSMDQVPFLGTNTTFQVQKITQPVDLNKNPRPDPNSLQASQGIGQNNDHNNHQLIDETSFYEQFFDTNKLTFEFEKFMLMQRNKRKTDNNSSILTSTMNTRQTLHSRTKSIEDYSNFASNKQNIRFTSKRYSLADAR